MKIGEIPRSELLKVAWIIRGGGWHQKCDGMDLPWQASTGRFQAIWQWKFLFPENRVGWVLSQTMRDDNVHTINLTILYVMPMLNAPDGASPMVTINCRDQAIDSHTRRTLALARSPNQPRQTDGLYPIFMGTTYTVKESGWLIHFRSRLSYATWGRIFSTQINEDLGAGILPGFDFPKLIKRIFEKNPPGYWIPKYLDQIGKTNERSMWLSN